MKRKFVERPSLFAQTVSLSRSFTSIGYKSCFNIIIPNVDPKMTQSVPSPFVTNAFHSPAAFTLQKKKTTIPYATSNVTEDTEI